MPVFLRALQSATKKYMRAAAGSMAKKMSRNVIKNALKASTDMVGTGLRMQFPTYADYSSGNIFLSGNLLSKRLKQSLKENNLKFMENVFKLSQEYVPIDKRYAKSTGVKFLNTGRKSIKGYLRSFADNNTLEEYFNLSRENKMNQLILTKRHNISYTEHEFTRKSGWYEASEVDYVKSMFRSSNKYARYEKFYYDETSGTIKARKNYTTNIFIDTGIKLHQDPLDRKNIRTSRVQPTGGFQELKKGGFLNAKDLNHIYISYGAYDKTRPSSTFNYAALQHDNLAFKHEYGRSLFLYKAFSQKRREWYNSVKDSISKELKK